MSDTDKIYDVVDNFWNSDKMTPEQIEEKFNVFLMKLRISLVQHSPFYSNLLDRLSRCVLATPEVCIKYRMFTAGTDGRHIIFCPAFVAKLTNGEFNYIVMHELYHILMNHGLRQQQLGINSQDKLMWNMACDGAINPLITDLDTMFKQMGLEISEPTGEAAPVYFDDECGTHRRESAEHFFNELKAAKKKGQNVESGDDSDDGPDAGSDTNNSENRSDDSDDNSENGSDNQADNSENESDDESDNESDNSENESDDQADNSENDSDDNSENCSESNVFNNSDSESDNESDNSSNNSADGQPNKASNEQSNSEMEDMLRRITGFSEDLVNEMYDEFYDELSDPVESDLKNYNESTYKDVYKKNQSSAPDFADRLYSSIIRKVPVKWSVYLRRFLTSKQSDDVSYSTPSKYYLPHGILKPGTCYGEQLDNISFYIDTSGSINNDELEEFFSIAYSIADQFQCTISIFLWHSVLYAEYKNIELDECRNVIRSIKSEAGGTRLKCCIDHMMTDNIKSVCNVVLTDGFIERLVYKIPKYVKTKTLVAIPSATCDSEIYPDLMKNLQLAGKVVRY